MLRNENHEANYISVRVGRTQANVKSTIFLIGLCNHYRIIIIVASFLPQSTSHRKTPCVQFDILNMFFTQSANIPPFHRANQGTAIMTTYSVGVSPVCIHAIRTCFRLQPLPLQALRAVGFNLDRTQNSV